MLEILSFKLLKVFFADNILRLFVFVSLTAFENKINTCDALHLA